MDLHFLLLFVPSSLDSKLWTQLELSLRLNSTLTLKPSRGRVVEPVVEIFVILTLKIGVIIMMIYDIQVFNFKKH